MNAYKLKHHKMRIILIISVLYLVTTTTSCLEVNETSSTPSAFNYTTTQPGIHQSSTTSSSALNFTTTQPETHVTLVSLNFITTETPLTSDNVTSYDSSESSTVPIISPRMNIMPRSLPRFPTHETPLFSVNVTGESTNETSQVTVVGVGPWARSFILPETINNSTGSTGQENDLNDTFIATIVYSYMPMTSWVFSDLEEGEDDEYDTDDESVEIIPDDLILTKHSADLKPLALLNPPEDLEESFITEAPIHRKTTKKGKIVKKKQKKKRKTTKKRKTKSTKSST